MFDLNAESVIAPVLTAAAVVAGFFVIFRLFRGGEKPARQTIADAGAGAPASAPAPVSASDGRIDGVTDEIAAVIAAAVAAASPGFAVTGIVRAAPKRRRSAWGRKGVSENMV
jgi:hypothetical protein